MVVIITAKKTLLLTVLFKFFVQLLRNYKSIPEAKLTKNCYVSKYRKILCLYFWLVSRDLINE